MSIEKVIAVDIDDTLNDFSQTLAQRNFVYNTKYGVSEELFRTWLPFVRQGLILKDARQYKDFVLAIHREVYSSSKVMPGACAFMNWLKNSGYKIIIMTYRDLRCCLNETESWLLENRITFDYLVSTDKKMQMCYKWMIPYLIDDSWKNILSSGSRGVQVFYAVTPRNEALKGVRHAIGYKHIEELKLLL